MGLGFWHPISEMPEQGFCEFPTEKDAREFIDFLCSAKCAKPLNWEDLSIEPYDKAMSDKLIAEGHTRLGMPIPKDGLVRVRIVPFGRVEPKEWESDKVVLSVLVDPPHNFEPWIARRDLQEVKPN